MTDEIELARRAVACDGWRWMHRMVDTEGMTYLGVQMRCEDGLFINGHLFASCERESWRDTLDGTLPDLTDSATLSCVLALVREAWGMPRMVAIPQPDGEWTVSGLASVATGDTEAAALVAALEAAPVGGAS